MKGKNFIPVFSLYLLGLCVKKPMVTRQKFTVSKVLDKSLLVVICFMLGRCTLCWLCRCCILWFALCWAGVLCVGCAGVVCCDLLYVGQVYFALAVQVLYFVICWAGIRECIVCGALAKFECKDCYLQHGQGLNTTAFCEQCIQMVSSFFISVLRVCAVCVCACVCVRVYESTHACVSVCVWLSEWVRACVRVCTCMSVCICVCALTVVQISPKGR